jgi:DNA-binding PadR family transcriptional regulator
LNVRAEPKTLVAHGLARAKAETVGRRTRTVYTITGKGWPDDPAEAQPDRSYLRDIAARELENGDLGDAPVSNVLST